MSNLSFNELRRANQLHGEPAHLKADGSDWSPAQWLQAMVGEVGEYANTRKKYERGDITLEEFQREGGKELADVQIYLDLLALQLGINLGQATQDKFNEVSDRVGASTKLPLTNNTKTLSPVASEQIEILERICVRGRNLFLNKSDSIGIDMFEHMETELGRLKKVLTV